MYWLSTVESTDYEDVLGIVSYRNQCPETTSIARGLFRTMRSRDQDVVIVRRTINLGYWEFGMGREWGGVEKEGVSL